jgi:hypothetical protein
LPLAGSLETVIALFASAIEDPPLCVDSPGMSMLTFGWLFKLADKWIYVGPLASVPGTSMLTVFPTNLACPSAASTPVNS